MMLPSIFSKNSMGSAVGVPPPIYTEQSVFPLMASAIQDSSLSRASKYAGRRLRYFANVHSAESQ